MFGGYDDTNDVDDFWVFNLMTNEWKEIESENGPSPRSGCKMIFDNFGNQLFIIGRKSMRGNDNFKVNFMN